MCLNAPLAWKTLKETEAGEQDRLVKFFVTKNVKTSNLSINHPWIIVRYHRK